MSHPRPPRAAPPLLVLLPFLMSLPLVAGAQSLPRLNDTGQTQCVDDTLMLGPCTAASTGDAAAHPGQDGRHGRDAASPTKTGGGEAGFDFTRLCWNGAAEGDALCAGPLVANTSGTPSGAPATDWACTRDNVTGLVWSLQTRANATWATANSDTSHNDTSRCGFADWRLPSVRELRSIVHLGRSNPTIDPGYFPATVSGPYWSSNTHAESALNVWIMWFSTGDSGFLSKGTGVINTRLVRRNP